jgi:glycosyltransferase involved in cell wall biosynthesis
LREIISDGVSGFIVDKQDPKELAEAVVRILQDGKLRFELAANGRKRVAETYQIRDQVEKVESLYAELMGWTRNEYIDG